MCPTFSNTVQTKESTVTRVSDEPKQVCELHGLTQLNQYSSRLKNP